MPGLLADVFSYGDSLKRKIGGLLADPMGTIELGINRLKEDNNNTLNLFANAYPMAGDKTVLNSPAQKARFQKQAADYASQVGLAGAVYGGKYGPELDKKFGDKLDAFLSDRGDVTTLSKIVVPREQRGEGIGTAFMQDLSAMADKDGVTLALSPSGDFGGSVGRLNQFYRSHGFVPNKGKYKDFSISETMLRPARNGGN